MSFHTALSICLFLYASLKNNGYPRNTLQLFGEYEGTLSQILLVWFKIYTIAGNQF